MNSVRRRLLFAFASHFLIVTALALPAWGQPPNAHTDPEFQNLYAGVSESCLTCHGNYKLFEQVGPVRKYFYIDRKTFQRSVHSELGCLGCHRPMRAGLHTRAEDGGLTAEQFEERARVELLEVRTCVGCHTEQQEQYRQSVHGLAALNYRVAEAPLCVDCHGNHYILPPKEPQAHTNPANVPVLCAKCHSDTAVNAKFGLNPEVVATYGESFHGKKEALGAGQMPVCVSCHGIHLIYAVDDERSMVNDANISRTCGQCHPGAERSFKAAFSHEKLSPLARAVLFYVEQFYLWMIFLVIGAMLLFISVHLLFHLRRFLETSR